RPNFVSKLIMHGYKAITHRLHPTYIPRSPNASGQMAHDEVLELTTHRSRIHLLFENDRCRYAGLNKSGKQRYQLITPFFGSPLYSSAQVEYHLTSNPYKKSAAFGASQPRTARRWGNRESAPGHQAVG